MSRKLFWLPGVAAGLAAGLALGFLLGYRAGLQPGPGLVPIALSSAETLAEQPVSSETTLPSEPNTSSEPAVSSELTASSEPDTAPIDLNTATLEELCTLPGIGEVLAGRILDYREAAGGFLQPEELMNVSGIGEKTYEKLKDLVTVTP